MKMLLGEKFSRIGSASIVSLHLCRAPQIETIKTDEERGLAFRGGKRQSKIINRQVKVTEITTSHLKR